MGLDICPVPYSNGNRYDFDSTFLQTQFFFLSLLHRNIMLLPKIFLLTTAIFITSNTIPTLAECNYTSYWETDEGNCIDLTELSRFPTDLSISSQPVEVKNLEIVSNDFGIDIQGVVTNISTRSVSIAEVSYGILDSNDRILYKGSFVLSNAMSPQESITMQDFIFSEDLAGQNISTLRLELLSVEYQ